MHDSPGVSIYPSHKVEKNTWGSMTIYIHLLYMYIYISAIYHKAFHYNRIISIISNHFNHWFGLPNDHPGFNGLTTHYLQSPRYSTSGNPTMAQKMPWITNRRCSLKPIILTQKNGHFPKDMNALVIFYHIFLWGPTWVLRLTETGWLSHPRTRKNESSYDF